MLPPPVESEGWSNDELEHLSIAVGTARLLAKLEVDKTEDTLEEFEGSCTLDAEEAESVTATSALFGM